MRILYYFIKNIETNEIKMEMSDIWLGDISELITLGNKKYKIVDYAEEVEDLEYPEDFKY